MRRAVLGMRRELKILQAQGHPPRTMASRHRCREVLLSRCDRISITDFLPIQYCETNSIKDSYVSICIRRILALLHTLVATELHEMHEGKVHERDHGDEKEDAVGHQYLLAHRF